MKKLKKKKWKKEKEGRNLKLCQEQTEPPS